MTKVRYAYFRWLYSQVDNGLVSYLKLSRYLDSRWVFYWTVPNDGNREGDGLEQRDHFLDTSYEVFSFSEREKFLSEPVSLFEVIIALCKRISYNVDEPQDPPSMDKWFLMLLTNLGLNYYTDDIMKNVHRNNSDIDIVVKNLLDRKYDQYGNGSFFPLTRKRDKNMTETEIWYQMMYYLDENY